MQTKRGRPVGTIKPDAEKKSERLSVRLRAADKELIKIRYGSIQVFVDLCVENERGK